MKKAISIVLLFFLSSIILTGCTSESRVNELQQEVDGLKSEITNIKEKIPTKDVVVIPTVKPTEITVEQKSDLNEYLNNMIKSNNSENWNEVAKCQYASEEHLIEIAKKCSVVVTNEYWSDLIADNIIKNKATTAAVIEKFTSAMRYSIWNKAVSSEKIDENTLIFFARKCCDTGINEKWAELIVDNIIKNKATTAAVIREFTSASHYSIWNKAVSSEKIDENGLIIFAQKFSDTGINEDWAKCIANNIINNKATTSAVLRELGMSCYNDINILALRKLEKLNN